MWNSFLAAKLKSLKMFVGFDLSSKLDFTAAVKVYIDEITDHYFIDSRFWLPEDFLENPKLTPKLKELYKEFHDKEAFKTTSGVMVDYEEVRKDFDKWVEGENLEAVAIDPWQAAQFCTGMMNDGIEVIEVRQNTKNLSEPMKQVQALIEAKKITHTSNPVMDWMMSNVVAKEDANENVYPRKQTQENKIDGASALLTAMSRVLLIDSEHNDTIPDISEDEIEDYII